MKTVSLKEKFSLFSDYCNPRILGEVNDCQVKAVKLKANLSGIFMKTKMKCFWW